MMIQKRAVVLGLAIFVLLAAGLAVVSPVFAQAVPADLCVRVTPSQDENGAISPIQRFTMNIHLESNDGVHFTVWGSVRIPQETMYAGGTGVLEGNFLTMNLTATQKHLDGWQDTGTIQAKYNIVTKAGTFYDIGHDFDVVSRQFDERYTSGTLRQCP